ncbi:MAG: glycoside hydrolase family 3 C-terminal domain-containing protein [Lachnospiraceae bacterium]
MEKENKEKKLMSKGKKIGIAIAGVVGVVLVVVVIYAFVLTNVGSYMISRLKPDSEEVKMSFESASQTTQDIADEGFVLMKNEDNMLPIETSSDNKAGINIFGMRGTQLVYNASGSTATDVENCLKLAEALTGEEGNFEVNEDLLYLYYNYYKSGNVSIAETAAPKNYSDSEFVEEVDNVFAPELPAEAFTDTSLYNDGKTIMEHAYEFSDTAMVVVGRGGGEVFDFAPSELQLQEGEKDVLDAVCATFDKVILVVNSANAMELDFIEEYPSIKSVVWIGYPGESGIGSLASILNGTVNPSGNLVDTWLKDNLAAPAANNYLELQEDGTWGDPDDIDGMSRYGNYHYSNTNDGEGYFVSYNEGIYVGYRYFETRHDTDESYNYDADVMYPFGYGLSYTTFEKSIMSVEESDGEITVRVAVKNTGDRAGKDTIQIYYNPPYTGKIEKSTVNLITFKKTNLIEAGAEEYYSLSFDVEEMASYDYEDNGCYVLEAGTYEIQLRENAHELLDSGEYKADVDVIYNDENAGGRSSDVAAAENVFDYADNTGDYLTREWDETSRAFTGPLDEDYIASEEVLAAINDPSLPSDSELGYTQADMPEIGVELNETILLSDMVDVDYEDPLWDEFVSQLTLEELTSLSGNGAWQIEALERLGVPKTATPDGTTAIGSSLYSGAIMGMEGSGVTYPTPVVIASTWNEEIAYIMGESIATEGKAIGYAGWYAPAMNTHRTAFNGRNFEYYSEDGVLAGMIAGNVIKAATDNGFITFMKHFALNDREMNARCYLFTWSNEQAIREVYLKPFEYAVKEGGSMGAMSSFNFIGYKWAGANENLLTDVLREEWGFEGLVTTDAAIYAFMDPAQASYAGGNLHLDVMAAWDPTGGGAGQTLLKAAEEEETKIGMAINLQKSAKNILYAVSRTWPVQEAN